MTATSLALVLVVLASSNIKHPIFFEPILEVSRLNNRRVWQSSRCCIIPAPRSHMKLIYPASAGSDDSLWGQICATLPYQSGLGPGSFFVQYYFYFTHFFLPHVWYIAICDCFTIYKLSHRRNKQVLENWNEAAYRSLDDLEMERDKKARWGTPPQNNVNRALVWIFWPSSDVIAGLYFIIRA